jgi:hypothetical protein
MPGVILWASPLILSFFPWEKGPQNYPQWMLWRPLSQGERDRVRGDALGIIRNIWIQSPESFRGAVRQARVEAHCGRGWAGQRMEAEARFVSYHRAWLPSAHTGSDFFTRRSSRTCRAVPSGSRVRWIRRHCRTLACPRRPARSAAIRVPRRHWDRQCGRSLSSRPS